MTRRQRAVEKEGGWAYGGGRGDLRATRSRRKRRNSAGPVGTENPAAGRRPRAPTTNVTFLSTTTGRGMLHEAAHCNLGRNCAYTLPSFSLEGHLCLALRVNRGVYERFASFTTTSFSRTSSVEVRFPAPWDMISCSSSWKGRLVEFFRILGPKCRNLGRIGIT